MRRILRVAEEEPLLVLLLAGFAVVFLSVFPPHLLVNDSFLTLVAGREVAENGLPSRDELTVIGAGEPWTDQQWGAQLLAYGAHALGGHGLLAVVAAVFVLAAFALAVAGARALGAGPRAIALLFFPVLLAAPWAWTIRAQVFALPLFTGLVWLLASEARRPTRRAYLALPLLVVWANLHGSVALGALLTMLLAASELVRRRGAAPARSIVLLALAPLAVLATPYGPVETARYYRLLLVDPPFAERVTEWQPSDPDWNTLLFYVLAAVSLGIVVWGRRRLALFDAAALALTFAGAVTAIRGIPWFALASLVLVPPLLRGALEGRAAPLRSRVNRTLALVAAGAVAAVAVLSLVRDASWYEREWPREAVPAVRQAAGDGSTVFATDRHANWLLWEIPELRGRIAYDVRFELYERSFFERLVAFHFEEGDGWKSLADGYDVVVVDERGVSHTEELLAEPGSRSVYADDRVTVVLRRPPAS